MTSNYEGRKLKRSVDGVVFQIVTDVMDRGSRNPFVMATQLGKDGRPEQRAPIAVALNIIGDGRLFDWTEDGQQ